MLLTDYLKLGLLHYVARKDKVVIQRHREVGLLVSEKQKKKKAK